LRKILNTSYSIVFSLFCAVIPFTDLGEAIPNIILIVLLILFPFVIKKEDWRRLLNKPFYALFFLVFITVVQVVVLGRWEDLKFIGRLLWLLLIIISALPIKNILTPILSFIFGAFVLLIVSSVNIVSYYLYWGGLDITSGDHVATVLLGDRPYIGFVYVLGFCLSVYVASVISKTKFLFYILSVLFFLFLLVISARISLISIAVITLTYFFYTKNLKKFGLIVFSLCLFCIVMFTVNSNLKKRFFISKNTYTTEQLMKFEPRYFIWSCAYKTASENMNYISGLGFENANEHLQSCYSERSDFEDKKKQNFFIRSKFNTHNQFLSFFISSGIFSFFFFFSFFLLWLNKSLKNYYAVIIILSIFFFSFVENVLSRQMGTELFAIALIFSNMISHGSESEI
jgi:hypothetical protein